MIYIILIIINNVYIIFTSMHRRLSEERSRGISEYRIISVTLIEIKNCEGFNFRALFYFF